MMRSANWSITHPPAVQQLLWAKRRDAPDLSGMASEADVSAAMAALPSVYCEIKNTDAAGAVSFTFPANRFSATPCLSLAVAASGSRDVAVAITSVDKNGAAIRVRRSRTLPAVLTLLSALIGYDVFEAPGVVSVHLTARAV